MNDAPAPDGLAVIDKPSGWTSHDVVAKCRGLFGTRKVGHSGTLDPMATGVLVLGVGRGTKLLRFLSGLPKTYSALIRLGVETDTLDAEGEVTAVHDMAPPDAGEVVAAATELTGDLLQVPPMVSAVKVGGRRLHELAREGREVEREPRPVSVSRFEVSPTDDPMVWEAEVACSSGTYVRVLAADLGSALGGGAHLAGLRRTSVGPFGIDEAHDMAEAVVLPPSELARVLESVHVDAEVAADVAHGKVLDRSRLAVPERGAGPWAVLGGPGAGGPERGPGSGEAGGAGGPVDRPPPGPVLLAVYEPHRDGTVKPVMVVPG